MKIFNVKDSWAKYYQSDKERQQEKKLVRNIKVSLKNKKAATGSWTIQNLTEDEKRLVDYKTKYYKSRKNTLWVGLNIRNWFL